MTNPTLRRVKHSEHGSHLEPPMDFKASELDKLRYLAAAAHLDEGLEIQVEVSSPARLLMPATYTVKWPGGASGTKTFENTWSFINGMRAGSRAG